MSRQHSGWEVLERRPAGLDAEIRKYVDVEMWSVRHRDGGPTIVYTMILDVDYVQMIGLFPNGDLILVVEDKIAEGPCLQAAAGRINDGESPERAALREFVEETGYTPGRIVSLGRCIPQSDRLVSRTLGRDGAKVAHLFCALDLVPSVAGHEETEKIRSVQVPWRVALGAVLHDTPVPGVGLRILETGTQRLILTLPVHPEIRPSLPGV